MASGPEARSAAGDAATAAAVDFEVVPDRVLVASLMGSGAQLNQNVFAPITNAPPSSLPDLQAKVVALAPQLVRVFFEDAQAFAPAPDATLDSFLRTVELAQTAGATINVTWAGGNLSTTEAWQAAMSRFADVLGELVTTRGVRNLSWVTLQNEPNTVGLRYVTPQLLEAMYRYLDALLVAKGLRTVGGGSDQQVRFMGGDLIQTNQGTWFAYMAEHMADILDAYSVHIYWDYDDTGKIGLRLGGVETIVAALAADARKPLVVTEYGVRGKGSRRRVSARRAARSGRRRSPRSSTRGSRSRRCSTGSPASSSGTASGASTTSSRRRSTPSARRPATSGLATRRTTSSGCLRMLSRPGGVRSASSGRVPPRGRRSWRCSPARAAS